MLPHSTPSKSRPMPPAKMRRSLAIQPPPPYTPSGPRDMILNSPVGVTTQLVDSRSPGALRHGHPLSAAVEDWMTEKSREELSNLLVAAGDLIKSRETELGLTSTFCKSLYQENFTLKTKHDALLARIPGRDLSPLPSPTRSMSPLPRSESPHFYSASRPSSPINASPAISRHVRRVSVTPGELSLLADQNAELLGKLEKLEEESAHADLAGKRKLRKLEKEIAGLRAELDKTREKGEELEQNLKKRGIGLSAEEEEEMNKRKREEREERVKALREKNGPPASSSESSLQEVKDFAPAPELPRFRTPSNPKAPVINFGTKPSAPPTIAEEVPHPGSAPVSAFESSSYLSPTATISAPSSETSQAVPQLEYALIAQLLAKIRELEEANQQITVEQKATADRLQAVHRDAESIRRAYDYLEDGEDELQIITEDVEEEGTSASPLRDRISTGNTIKFSSLRRTIDGDVSRLEVTEDPRQDFASGIMKQSTTRSTLGLESESLAQRTGNVLGGQKSRKSVVGLFDAKPEAGAEAGLSPLYPPTLSISPGFRILSPIPFPGGAADTSVWSIAATDGEEGQSSPSSLPVSPSPSVYASPLLTLTASNLELLPASSSLAPARGGQKLHTLGSELGSEFGDDWGEKAGNHHLRATSIADMSAFWLKDTSGVGSSSSSPAAAPQLVLPSPSTSPRSDSVWEDVDESPRMPATSATSASASGNEIGTPTKGSRNANGLQLQFVIEPPTPSPGKIYRTCPSVKTPLLGASASTSALTLRESRSSRNLRLSQTVRARTSRWVERVEKRYMVESPVNAEDAPPFRGGMSRRRSLIGLNKRQRKTSTAMDDTFEEVAHAISRSFSGSAVLSQAEEDEIDGDCGSALRREVVLPKEDSTVVVGGQAQKKPGFVGFVLEVWLWLQFAIVVCVFLWAMARRGPKSILADAERRKGEVQRTSRR
ncbi:hypothetical protein BC835DRAFT_1397836 [Cytidiella melzeri]|nr:hypothetical protein BC835DRAFT_1397836 [Cytidiella melzeri]